jgi:hypothetical protein
MNVEWLREVETSLEVVRLTMLYTLFSYQIQSIMILALLLYPNITLCSSQKIFQDPYGTILKCCSVVRTVTVVAIEAEIFPDFHVYNNPNIPILIGRPTERLFQEMANSSLAVQLDEATQTVSLARARNALAKIHDRFKDDPTENPEDTLSHLDAEQGKEPSSVQIHPASSLLT